MAMVQVANGAPAAQAHRGAAGSRAAGADASNDQVIAAMERLGGARGPAGAINELELLQLAAAKDDTPSCRRSGQR